MADLVYTVPKTRAVLPSVASTFVNGHAPDELLRSWDGRGKLLILPSYGMQALQLAAINDGVFIGSTGRNRTAARQWQMLHERYVPYYIPNARDTNRVKSHFYAGRWYPEGVWYLKPGYAMAAVPETSNHGKACADDVCTVLDDGDYYIHVSDTGDRQIGLDDRSLEWMRENAQDLGWGLETWSERWHWHWLRGNVLPQRAIDILRFCQVPIRGLGEYNWEPGQMPPEPSPEPVPAFDPDNELYGLWPVATKTRIGAFSVGDHVRYAKGVLRDQVARFLLWFAVAPGYEYLAGDVTFTNQANGKTSTVDRRDLMKWGNALCQGLDPNDPTFDGNMHDVVLCMQAAFNGTTIDGRSVGRLDADGVIGPSQTWPFIDSLADKTW